MEDNTTPEKLFVEEFMEEFVGSPANEVFIVFTHPFPFKLGGQIRVHTFYVFRAVRFETPPARPGGRPKGLAAFPHKPQPRIGSEWHCVDRLAQKGKVRLIQKTD